VLLTKSFTVEEYARALETWRWLGVEGKTPVLASVFGDVFPAGCRRLLVPLHPRRDAHGHVALGQVHQQADALAPGSPVYGLDVDDAGNLNLRRTP